MINLKKYCLLNNFDKDQTYILENLETYLNFNKIPSNFFDNLYKLYDLSDTKIYDSQENVIPKHYNDLPIQPIDFITQNNLDFCSGNIVKYVSRLGNKDSKKDELKKIFFYFDFLINKNSNKTREIF